jgi:uncharacterized membrane protein
MGRTVAWSLMALLAGAIGLVATPYLFGEVSFAEQRPVFEAHPVLLFSHVLGGITALVIGPWQFLPNFRSNHVGLHRALGSVYMVAIIVGAAGGAALAPMAHGGLPSSVGFSLLAVSWLTTSAMALRAILSGRVEVHRRWMLRSYACTFAAVTLRLWLPFLQFGIGMPFTAAYVTVAWLSWVPNLLFVELMLRRERNAAQTTLLAGAATGLIALSDARCALSCGNDHCRRRRTGQW